MRFVELEEARQASGLRLVIATNVPSPWSQAALGLFDVRPPIQMLNTPNRKPQ